MHTRSLLIGDLLEPRVAPAVVALALVTVGCGTDEVTGVTRCDPGQMLVEGVGCAPAGVTPEACGPGFVADGEAGCEPILPEDPCPRGQMAVPGDAECRDVAPCGEGDYGTTPRQDDPTTQFVNGAYPGDDSDGTRAKPWKRIQDGVRFARSGAVVAVAAGSYDEDLLIEQRPVQVWGRCPALVEVVGTVTMGAALRINSRNARRSEVHSLAITGPGAGVLTAASTEVLLDRVWVHDTMHVGIGTEDLAGETSLIVRDSLIEAASYFGVLVSGSDATIDATSVRATRPYIDGEAENGHGISVNYDHYTDGRPRLTLRTSLVEQNHEAGVVVYGTDATIEATVVRDTGPRGDGTAGHGISIEGSAAGQRATVTLQSSLVERNHELGVRVVGADATIDATVVRATRPHDDGTTGRGIEVEQHPDTHERAALTLRRSLVAHNQEIGVFVGGSDATIDATVLRDTDPRADGTRGYGVAAVVEKETRERARLTMRGCLVDQNRNAGVTIAGADASVEETIIRSTRPREGGVYGRGIEILVDPETQERAAAVLRGSLVEQNHDVGVLVLASDATIEATTVSTTQPNDDGTFGDGITVSSNGYPANARITSTTVEANARAGISNFSAGVVLISSIVQCNTINLAGEDEVEGRRFTFDGSTSNLFGCGETLDPTLVVQSARLAPPPPLDPVRPIDPTDR